MKSCWELTRGSCGLCCHCEVYFLKGEKPKEKTKKKKKDRKAGDQDVGGSNWLIGCKFRLEKISDPAIQATRKVEKRKGEEAAAEGKCQAGGMYWKDS